MKAGVYMVEQIATGRVYIGSSINLHRRLKRHASRLRIGQHANRALQKAWNKHGEAAFRFRPLFICAPDDLVFFEQRAVDHFRSNVKPYGFNVRAAVESNRGNPGNDRNSPGARYGRLTLVRLAERLENGNKWLCRCDCGRETVANVAAVRQGSIRSCGCIKTEMLQTRYRHKPGERYGRLTLVEPRGLDSRQLALWLCRCDCGAEKISPISFVKRGKVRSCGCLRVEIASRRVAAIHARRRGVMLGGQGGGA